MDSLTQKTIKESFEKAENKPEFLNNIRQYLAELSPTGNPVATVLFVPVEQVKANDYNPNSVANQELKLLYTSIKQDGYTQPVVTVYDKKRNEYIIVDGYHRYSIMKRHRDIYDSNNGLLPVVVLNKDINDRMASTIRHNRARGSHNVGGMSNVVFNMLENGWKDQDICDEIGLEPDELLRLKHITGFSKLFKDVEYSKAWETVQQLRYKKDFNSSKENNGDTSSSDS